MKWCKLEDVEQGMSMQEESYLDINSGELANRKRVIGEDGKIISITYQEDLSDHNRYILLPFISCAYICQECLKCYPFPENVLEENGINLSNQYQCFGSRGWKEHRNELDFLHKCYGMFEANFMEEEFLEYRRMKEREIAYEWSLQNGFELINEEEEREAYIVQLRWDGSTEEKINEHIKRLEQIYNRIKSIKNK